MTMSNDKQAAQVTDAQPADGEDEPKTMSGTMSKYRKAYEPTVAYSGRVSLNKGDEVATMLAGLSPLAVIEAAERLLGFESGELVAKYAHLNPGQKRMNGGNRIRSAIKREAVTIADLKQARGEAA